MAARPAVQTAVWGQLVGQGLDPPALLTRFITVPLLLVVYTCSVQTVSLSDRTAGRHPAAV